MSNNYCLKASGKQIVELARLMDVHSRRTGFDEPILYLGDACRLEPIPYSKVYATCDTPRIFSACLVDESGSHDLMELTDLFGVVGLFPHHPRLLPSYFSTQKLKFCGEYVSVYCAYVDLLHYQPPCNNCLRSPYAVHGETTDDAWKPIGKWQNPYKRA